MEATVLTRKQLELLVYIDTHMRSNGVAPSFEEMKAALSLKSKSGIHRLVSALEERGFLRRLPHRARALEVIKLPASFQGGSETLNSNDLPNNVIEGKFGKETSNYSAEYQDSLGPENVSLPLYGRIAAGLPIEALRDETESIDVPSTLLGSGEYYALEVAGDSMIDVGIFDGDIAIIQRSDTADNGSIIVALIDDNEVTLKRIRRKGESIALEPENLNHETRIFGPGRVKVQGRIAGIIRKYDC
tara:strand:- start:366 stop:1100 length:735 start_codon:yes stop_codon:yes gene_type:complete